MPLTFLCLSLSPRGTTARTHKQQRQQRGGRKKLGLGGSPEKGGGGAARRVEGAVEKVRHHNGTHVFYLYMTAELGILCVTDGIPIDQEVLATRYLRPSINDRNVSDCRMSHNPLAEITLITHTCYPTLLF